MVKRIVLYVIAVLFLSITSVYTYNYELMYAVLAMILFPIVDMIMINNSGNKIDVNIDIKKIMLKKGEAIPIETRVNNKGILPVVMVQFEFICKNVLHNTSRNISLHLPILRWGKQHCIFSIKSEYCGDLIIELKDVKVIDYFGFKSKNIEKKFKKKIYIMPNNNNVELIKVDNLNSSDIEGKEFSKYKSGDDPAEVFDIREYRAGDKIHSIHWKLTARKNEIMVKEFSLPINSNYSVIMDLSVDNKEKHKEVDAVIEATMDIILQLQEQGINHQIVAYERNGKYVYKDIIDTNASIVDIMYELYQSKIFVKKDLLSAYEMRDDVNDETNIYYVSSTLNRESIDLLDKIFDRANKVYIYISGDEIDEDYVKGMEEVSDIKILGLNINELTTRTANIYI
ncbi:MAG: DUF58 domain-containing protein [Lachnospiraceae bacterium]|nr:DUF58 domain-containing protein [Lachnospiraceae bacterium]